MVGTRQVAAVLVVAIVATGGIAFFFLSSGDGRPDYYAPWPMMGGNAKHDRMSPLDAPEGPYETEWILEIPEICGPIVVDSENRIYFNQVNESVAHIYCVNGNGTIEWKTASEDLSSQTSPTLGPDGCIYLGEDLHYLSCYYPTGELKWRKTAEIVTPPIISHDHVYVATENKVIKYDFDGAVIWDYVLENQTRRIFEPLVADNHGTIYVTYYTGNPWEQGVVQYVDAIFAL